jgi:lysophospholipase L1-like esterase
VTLQPKADSTINLIVSPGPNNNNSYGFYYLGALKIIYEAEEPPPYSEITLVSPNGYQRWEAGSKRKILFSAINVNQVTLEYSLDNGINWTTITSTAEANKPYEWSAAEQTSDLCLMRISDTDNTMVSDVSDHVFSIVEKRQGGEQDFIFFSDSPTSSFYDPSWGYVNVPSTLERVGDKFPVSSEYSLVGNYALKLNWNSKSGGDWGIAVAGIGWVGRDVTTKDTLELNVFTKAEIQANNLPYIFLEDLNNKKSTKLPMSNFTTNIDSGDWRQLHIPMKAFRDNPGAADMTRIKTVYFSQNAADSVQHTLFLDDIRMTGGKIISGDSSVVIVVLGSSTAAGTGPSKPDSAWVNRYRNYLQSMDTTVQVINLAVGGYTTYDIMPTGYVPPAGRPTPKTNNNITKALTYKPDAIIINLPSNDATNNYTISEQLANYDTVLARASQQNVPVWITTTQPRNLSQTQRKNLMDMRDSTFARFGDQAIDFWTEIANLDGTINSKYNSGDGVHINDAGHRIFFERVVDAGIWEYLTVIEERHSNPITNFELSQNYPNPFNPATTIAYSMPSAGFVTIKVYDLLGREVDLLYNGMSSVGKHNIVWNATRFSSGIYFYLMTVKESGQIKYHQTRKLILVK